jgi:hypothetical protein
MASRKNNKSPSTKSSPRVLPSVDSEATATLLSFANPPQANDPHSVAADCCSQGFSAIGINMAGASEIIDFSLIDDQMCADLASALEICVTSNGFFIPALTGTLQVLHEKSSQITLGNFVNAIAQVMRQQSEVQ